MDLFEALDTASASDRRTFRPEFFRLSLPTDRQRLEAVLKSEPGITVHDELHAQLVELVRTLDPSVKFGKEELQAAANAHLNGMDPHSYGVWVYYPWSRQLVHLLDEAEFVQVRTDRNRNKITSEEQAILATKKVGVIGLSVGQSVCLTMALERSFGELRIADFDTLELSNLNRIRSSTHEMGNLKTVNVAREIAEIDPFLKVTCYNDGINESNIDAFMTEGGKLDVLVEECDSVDVKIRARQRARIHGIPVVMDMSDRGCLDVERFDIEPGRPIMHGWVDHLDLDAASNARTSEEKTPYMLPIVGIETLSTRMKASMIEMGQTIGTWPQLATSVVLGGALAGDVCRRIFLDQFRASGRWFVDLDELVSNDEVDEVPNGLQTQSSELSLDWVPSAFRKSMELFPTSGRIDPTNARAIAEAGALAPSAGNMQPWHFVLGPDRVLLVHDTQRSSSRWDPDHLMAHIALGACIENMTIKAQELGLRVRVSMQPIVAFEELIAMIHIESSDYTTEALLPDDLSRWITERCTNRKVVSRDPIPISTLSELRRSVDNSNECDVLFFTGQEELDELAEICSSSEKVRILDPIGHQEFFEKEVRWNELTAQSTKDGLDLDTMELSLSERAALEIASDSEAIKLVDLWKGGKALERFSKKGIRTAGAVALITVPDGTVNARIVGGRTVQRFWMRANSLGVSVHPISAPIFLFHAQPMILDLKPSHRQELLALESRFNKVVPTGRTALFMMRLSYAGEPSTRSLRRPLDDMIISIS